jgi:hypothetical protein
MDERLPREHDAWWYGGDRDEIERTPEDVARFNEDMHRIELGQRQRALQAAMEDVDV